MTESKILLGIAIDTIDFNTIKKHTDFYDDESNTIFLPVFLQSKINTEDEAYVVITAKDNRLRIEATKGEG